MGAGATIDGRPARILAASAEFDLALLQTAHDQGNEVAVFSASPARSNSDVTVADTPLRASWAG